MSANEHSIPFIDVNRIVGKLIDAMTDEDIDKIKQLLMEAPLGYMPKTEAESTIDATMQKQMSQVN